MKRFVLLSMIAFVFVLAPVALIGCPPQRTAPRAPSATP